jgi:hypothetical protein
LTLVAVPVAYSFFDDLSMFLSRRKSRAVKESDKPEESGPTEDALATAGVSK